MKEPWASISDGVMADPALLPGGAIFALGGTRQAKGDTMGAKSVNAYLSSNRP